MTTQNARLAAQIRSFSDATVVCIGDVMLDCFVRGAVDRVSPEAPVPVLRVVDESFMLGGVGNVVRNLVGLTVSVRLLSVLGEDTAAATVTRHLAALPSVLSAIERDPRHQTGVKTRYHAAGQQLLRVDREVPHPLSPAFGRRLLRRLPHLLEGSRAVVLSDYGKGVLTGDVIRAVLAQVTPSGIPVLVDPKAKDFSVYRGAFLITPNRKELAEAVGQPVHTDTEVVDAARAVISRCDISHILVTRSEDGMTLVSKPGARPAGEVTHFPARAQDVYDVSGAGDTVVAALAAGLAAGFSLDDAVVLANVSAGIVVGKTGTAAVTMPELVDALRDRDRCRADARILDAERVVQAACAWRGAGLTVGLTNGCFDLLHPGHLSLLRQARARCDRLIVAVNSDYSVRGLKGPQRPIQPESARALVLASLEMVDAVVVFNEETPINLIATIRPDLLVKGADYTRDTVVGADLVMEAGGDIFFAELEPEQSTTKTVSRLPQEA